MEQAEPTQPVVIELGKVGRSKIKDLKRGHGKFARDVAQALAAVRNKLGVEAEGKILVPVILLYRKKARKRAAGMPFLPW